MNQDKWEAVIGLETHALLNTKSKLFSRAPNSYSVEPNTNISVGCTAQPGTLPILNKEAVFKAVQFGCAIGGKINKKSRFDRKTYFYPDNPRNFQITQFERPLICGGAITTDLSGKMLTFQIEKAHLEDDSGTLKHLAGFTGIDYNRAGAPLIEIISAPCIHSASEAIAYAIQIRTLLLYIGVSDCNMESGGLRFDVNISVRKKGETSLRPKIEIKNMNSFRHIEQAIEVEIERQIKLYESHPHTEPEKLITPETYRFDVATQKPILMRRKEGAEDYLYFPEPDLPPIVLTDEYIEQVKLHLPELPQTRYAKYTEKYALPPLLARILINNKPLSDYYDKASLSTDNHRSLCNWIVSEFPGKLKELGKTLPESGILPEHISELVKLIDSGKTTGHIAKKLADLMIANPSLSPVELLHQNPNLESITDPIAITALIDKALEENPKLLTELKTGNQKASRALIGQVLKLSNGKASPELIQLLINQKLSD